jgi:ABC-2 type transport system permease protein
VRMYLAALRMSYRRYRAYGAANVAGLITNAFFGALRSYVFIALYRAQPVAAGYDLGAAVTYVWLTQAMIMPVYLWGWQEIALTIRTGAVATDLARPFDYFGFWLSRDFGRALYHLLYRWLPTVLTGLVFFRIRLPTQLATWLLFAVSLTLAIVISFCLRFMINVCAFWTTDIRGINGMVLLFVNFLSGFLVPVAFFPPALRAVALALPFTSIISTPVNILLGQAHGADTLVLLGQQVLWAAVFVAAARLLVRSATRKVVVQGG